MNQERQGTILASVAYIIWGFLPLYWKLLDDVLSIEVLAHRILWSFFLMLFILTCFKKWNQFKVDLRSMVKNKKLFMSLLAAGSLISGNWFIYIWAVNNNHVIEASLGYYINPLVTVLLGMLVLKEKLNFWQYVSFLLAFIGVAVLTIQFGGFPWIAISLAVSFALYSLVKKVTNYDSMLGLTFETMIVFPISFIFILVKLIQGSSAFGQSEWSTHLLLIGAGVVTAIPLLLFSQAAKSIPMYIIGFLQYIAPTISLILGIFIFKEVFTFAHMTAFIFIWLALMVFTISRFTFKPNIKWRKRKTVGV